MTLIAIVGTGNHFVLDAARRGAGVRGGDGDRPALQEATRPGDGAAYASSSAI